MSEYYKIPRGSDWNYGGSKWKLSRSKIELFLKCPRCFYLDNKLGVKQPPGFPFNLNSAVDFLLKKEFDIHRAEGSTHPLVESYGLDLIPYDHPKIDEWRENFKGVSYFHEPTSMTITGAIDDLWINREGELVVVDYKSTSKDETVTLDADWQKSYKNQMEIYQWLLRQNGFKVSDTGYFVYANGLRDRKAFDGKLEFEVSLIPYTGKSDWVEGVIYDLHQLLTQNNLPPISRDCDFCQYRQVAGRIEA